MLRRLRDALASRWSRLYTNMTDYKSIFEGIESTLFEIGSRKLSRDLIRAELEPYKYYEDRRLSDDEYYRMLVHIAFYSGFRASTVSSKLAVIDRHFPSYGSVANYGEREINSILNDPEMIRNQVRRGWSQGLKK